jgi:cytochrome c553
MHSQTRERKVPQEITASRAKLSTPQTARVDNDVVGECPVCHEPMGTSMANGIPVYICNRDTIVLPLPDNRA